MKLTKETFIQELDSILQRVDKSEIAKDVQKMITDLIYFNYDLGVEAILPKKEYDKFFKDLGTEDSTFFSDKATIVKRVGVNIETELASLLGTAKSTKAQRKEIIAELVTYIFIQAQYAKTFGKNNGRKVKKYIETKDKAPKYTPKSTRGVVAKLFKK